jgi:hypothetical protein
VEETTKKSGIQGSNPGPSRDTDANSQTKVAHLMLFSRARCPSYPVAKSWANQLFVPSRTRQMAVVSQHPHMRFVDPVRDFHS